MKKKGGRKVTLSSRLKEQVNYNKISLFVPNLSQEASGQYARK